MFSGKVSGLYAFLHHRKWYERKMAEKAAWEAHYEMERLADEAAAHESSDDATSSLPLPQPAEGK
jgi:predicted metal-dependent hydrolase